MRAILVLSTLLLSTAALASWIAPKRPLEPREKVASTVGDSPFIAVGKVVAAYDTVVTNGGAPAAFAVVLFEPVRVLRGASDDRRVRVIFWKTPSEAPGSRAGERVAVHGADVPRWSCSLDEAIRRIGRG